MNVGIHRFTAEEYHADPSSTPSLSSSIAKILIDQSPQHAWMAHPKLNPNFKREVDSRFDMGSAAHLMLLERREDVIVVVDADDWRTKAAKEARDAAQAAGKFAILAKYITELMAMCAVAREFAAESEIGDIFDTGFAEQTLLWQTGNVWCRARPDLRSHSGRIMLDYKTTENASPDAFTRQIGRMGYDLQAEFYLAGERALEGFDNTTFVFLAQEITPPYACSLLTLSNAYRAVGQSKVKRALSLWDRCMETKNWPGYPNRLCVAEPKPWDISQAEELAQEAA